MYSAERPFLQITARPGAVAVTQSPLLPVLYIGFSLFMGVCLLSVQQSVEHAAKQLPDVATGQVVTAVSTSDTPASTSSVLVAMADHPLASEDTRPISDVQRLTAHLAGTLMTYDAQLMPKAQRTAHLQPRLR